MKIDIKRVCYELYKIDWKRLHNITYEREKEFIRDYYKNLVDESYTYNDYIEEFGYNGELYVCFEEFCDYEYYDIDYMRTLLDDDNLISQYHKDIEESEE